MTERAGQGGETTGPAKQEVPHTGTLESSARMWPGLLLAMAIALVVRLLFVYQSRDVPFIHHLVGDAAGYFAWAQRIAAGEWIGSESFYQAPLYPYILAVLFKAWASSVGVVRIAQSVWGVVAVGCLGFGTACFFERRAGLLAALMLSVYPPAVFFDGIVQKTSLGCWLLCSLIALLGLASRLSARRLLWGTAGVGAVAGLLTLTRENAIVWLPLLPIWLWTLCRPAAAGRGGNGATIKTLGSYVVGVGLVLGPVAVRNASVSGEWSLSTFQAGPNFYIGNHRGADGRYRPLVPGHETPAFERRDATALAERASERTLSSREVSQYWMSRAWTEIRSSPRWWLRLMGRKAMMVVNRYEVSDAESQYVYEAFSPLLAGLGSVWHFGVLFPLAVVGVVLTRVNWRRLWILYLLVLSMASSVVLFYVMARYRFPLVPLLIPLAAAGCVELWDRLRTGRGRSAGGAIAGALVVALVANWPLHDEKRLNALAWMNVGVALAQEGDLPGATAFFRRAVSDHPLSAEANNNLAQALAVQGDFAGAIPFYETAVRVEPRLIGTDYNLAVALEAVGRTSEALNHYRRAVALDPSDREAIRAVARLAEPTP